MEKSNNFDFDKLYQEDTYKADIVAQARELQDIADNAKACLNDGKFIKYKEGLQKSYDGILDSMIMFNSQFNGTSDAYARKMSMFIQKIYDLRVLLHVVESDKNKGLIPEEYTDGKN